MSLTKPRKSRACMVAILVGASWLTAGSRADEPATRADVPATLLDVPPVQAYVPATQAEVSAARTADVPASTEPVRPRRRIRGEPVKLSTDPIREIGPDGTYRLVPGSMFAPPPTQPATEPAPAATPPQNLDLRQIDEINARQSLESWKNVLLFLGGGVGLLVMLLGTASLFRILFGRPPARKA